MTEPRVALSNPEARPTNPSFFVGVPEPQQGPLDRAAPDDAPSRGSLYTLRQKADIAERVWPGTRDAPIWLRWVRCVLVHSALNGITTDLTPAERVAMAAAVEP